MTPPRATPTPTLNHAPVVPHAWQWATPLDDRGLDAALAHAPLDTLVPDARRWLAQRQQQNLLEARGAPRPRPSRTGRTERSAPSTATPPGNDAGAPVTATGLFATLTRHPGWATAPDDPRWAVLLATLVAGTGCPAVMPLLVALHLDHGPMVALLLANGAMDAVNRPGSAVPRRSLTPGAVDARSRAGDGATMVHAMVQCLAPSLLQRLLALGGDVNARTFTGVTPLMALAIDEPLTFPGLSALAALEGTVVPRHLALPGPALMGSTPILNLIPWDDRNDGTMDHGGEGDAGDGDDARVEQALGQRLDVLVAAGADLDAVDRQGHTALHLAVSGVDHPMIRALLDRGADPAIVNGNGFTPQEELSYRLMGEQRLRAMPLPVMLPVSTRTRMGTPAFPVGSAMATLDPLGPRRIDQQTQTLAVLQAAITEQERRRLHAVFEAEALRAQGFDVDGSHGPAGTVPRARSRL